VETLKREFMALLGCQVLQGDDAAGELAPMPAATAL
jgi:hypothetical protein